MSVPCWEWRFARSEADLAGFAVSDSQLDAASGHPESETVSMMFPAKTAGLASNHPLGIAGSSKLAAPDDEGIFQQVSLLEIPDEAGTSLVDFPGERLDPFRETSMMIPARVIELDIGHSALGQSAASRSHKGIRRQ